MPFLKVGQRDIYYEVKGYGPAIVYFHPPMLTSANFVYQLEQLSKSYQVIAFDLNGHGKSGSTVEPFTYRGVAEDTISLLEHLGIEQAYLCGYSAGGTIVLESLLSFPDRFHGGILLGGLAEIHENILKADLRLGLALSKRGAIKTLAFGIALTNADRPRTFLNLYRSMRDTDVKKAYEYYQCVMGYDYSGKLGRIHKPILLLQGEKDTFLRSYTKQLEDLPNAQLILIPGAKHHLPTKYAKAVNKEIDQFIQKIEEKRRATIGTILEQVLPQETQKGKEDENVIQT